MTCLGLKPIICETACMSFAPVSDGCIIGCFIFSVFLWEPRHRMLAWHYQRATRLAATGRTGDPVKEQVYHEADAICFRTGAFVMTAKKKFASDTFQYAYTCYISDDPEQVASYEEELADAELTHKLYDLRTKSGLT